jgi:quercetin dioxygenase-like cupin family protein
MSDAVTTSEMLAVALAQASRFASEGRMVQRLHRSPEADVLLVCWEPGQRTRYHDHGRSESTVVVLAGRLRVRSGADERHVGPHDLVVTPRGAFHEMQNDGAQRAMTLHVYAPPLEGPISAPFIDHTVALDRCAA